MITEGSFTQMALSFPGTEQVPHFERIGFKVTGKRMFTTYLQKDNTAGVKKEPPHSYLTVHHNGSLDNFSLITSVPVHLSCQG